MKLTFVLVILLTVSFSCDLRQSRLNTSIANKDSLAYVDSSIAFFKSIMTTLSPDSNIVLVDSAFKITVDEAISRFSHILIDSPSQAKKTISYFKISKWENSMFTQFRLVTKIEIDSMFNNLNGWEIFYLKYGSGFNAVSPLIFVHDYQYAILYIDNSCGWLCGSGSFNLFAKRDGHWVRIERQVIWVS